MLILGYSQWRNDSCRAQAMANSDVVLNGVVQRRDLVQSELTAGHSTRRLSSILPQKSRKLPVGWCYSKIQSNYAWRAAADSLISRVEELRTR